MTYTDSTNTIAESNEGNNRYSRSWTWVPPVPAPFDLLSPANHAASQLLSGTLRWEASTDVDHYSVYLSTDPQPSWVGDVTGTSYDYSGLSPNTKYYWGILAVGAGGQTRSTPFAFDFTTGAPPGPFSLTSPADNATDQDTSGTLSWGSSSGATSYDVYFGTDNPPVDLLENVTGTSTPYSGCHADKTYYWCVVAKNTVGQRQCEGTFQFTTFQAGAVREEASVTLTRFEFGLDEASPNPFRGNTTISYALPRDGSVRLYILNASGAVVRTLRDGPGQRGVQRTTWDGTDDRSVHVGKGVYFCSLEAGEFVAVRKMVKTD